MHLAAKQALFDAAAGPSYRWPSEPVDRENYEAFDDNPVKRTAEQPVATFSIDVDTAAYANVRRFLNQGALPRHDAVRVEELINYFGYNYPVPQPGGHPFSVYTELGPSPWHPQRKLLHIGIQGMDRARESLPPTNLVFLVDVSGSMNSADKIGLLKTSLKLLTRQLRDQDRLSIAVYAGAAGTVLEPTAGRDTGKIIAALDQLTAGGSTNGGAGIRLAYALAESAFIPGGINRVILATDGDFNVGTVNFEALEELVEEKRASGVTLTVLGFGAGNYNDNLAQRLAQTGNGNAAYIDTVNEARKVLVDEMTSTLETIAQDVKIQVEFNPAQVSEYRLVGYETRHLEREDFTNDRVDAGEIGAGHTVTAIFELALVGAGGGYTDPLRYGRAATTTRESNEIALLRLRHKQPGHTQSILQEFPIAAGSMIDALADTSDSYRFSAAVAGFGQLLRGGRYTESFGFDDVLSLAHAARGQDSSGYRGEFVGLVKTAEALSTRDAREVSQR
jgi:Ca-activated chloride channel family protein